MTVNVLFSCCMFRPHWPCSGRPLETLLEGNEVFAVFRCVSIVAKSVCCLCHVRPSVSVYVRLHISARLPLDGFRWNLILGRSVKICHEIPVFFKIRLKFSATLTCWSKYLLLLLTALDRHKSTRFEWNGIRLLG